MRYHIIQLDVLIIKFINHLFHSEIWIYNNSDQITKIINFLKVKIWFQNRRAKERRALKKQEDTLVKEKLDPSAAAVHAMSAFTESITAAHQYNNGSAIATAAGQMAIGLPHVSGNPHVSTGTGFPGHSMMASAPYGMSMKFE